MDFSIRSWEDDFSDAELERYSNLKCLLPSRVIPSLVAIVKEFDITGVQIGDPMYGKMEEDASMWSIWSNERA